MKSVARRIKDLDRALFRAIFRFKWPPFTSVMRVFTIIGAAGFAWGVTAGVAFLFTGLEPLSLIVPWGAVAGSWTVTETMKHYFDRARPFMSDTEISPLIKTPSSSSFPSGHSATAAAGAITLSAAYPVFTPIFLLTGLLIVLSRVYLGVHYPFDVLAGVLIGTVTAGLFLVAAGLVA